MKIKKKEYEKQLDDRYWNGVKTGMQFAIDHPEDARHNVDHIDAMRLVVEKAQKAFEPLIEGLRKVAEQISKQ